MKPGEELETNLAQMARKNHATERLGSAFNNPNASGQIVRKRKEEALSRRKKEGAKIILAAILSAALFYGTIQAIGIVASTDGFQDAATKIQDIFHPDESNRGK